MTRRPPPQCRETPRRELSRGQVMSFVASCHSAAGVSPRDQVDELALWIMKHSLPAEVTS